MIKFYLYSFVIIIVIVCLFVYFPPPPDSSFESTCCIRSDMFFSKSSTLLPISSSIYTHTHISVKGIHYGRNCIHNKLHC
uniref:Uncharacterized protein n=1 Tax=Amphimedon queenslandica TaxID=400682 RepID=A0A1X7VBP4_AMPQE